VKDAQESTLSTGIGDDGGASAFHVRLQILAALFLLPLIGLVAQLYNLQISQGEHFAELAGNNFIRVLDLTPDRGIIYDARGRMMAENRPSFDVYITPNVFRRRENAAQALTTILSLSDDERAALERRLSQDARADYLVRRDITRDQLAALETNFSQVPGSFVAVSQRRHYPFDGTAAHLLGFMNEVRADELQQLEEYGYQPRDYIGRTGIERAFEAVLRGAPGIERQVVNVGGVVQPDEVSVELLGNYRRVEPVAGRNLHLTVDMRLQEIVDETTFNRVSGGIVALDPRDGAILAMFSKPGFNPNAWSGRLSTMEQRESDNNPYHPMIDKSVQSWFPGSTYKVVVALAALEEGLIHADDIIDCPGYFQYGDRRFRCWNRAGHGETNLHSALAESCDVYFYQLGLQLGIDRMAQYAYELGFGERPGLGFNGDSAGVVPTRAWHEAHSPGGFQYGFTVNTSVGQGDTRASPLQLALSYAALVNGGTLYYPRIVDRITSEEGRTVFEYPRRMRRQLPFAEANLAQVVAGLEAVVQDPHGTAFSHRIPWMTVAGKSGTAQVRSLESVRLSNGEVVFRDRDHAWFVAVAPLENPRIVVSVFLEHGGQGSGDAAPVAMEIIDRYFREVLGWNDAIEVAMATGDRTAIDALIRGDAAPVGSTGAASTTTILPAAMGANTVSPLEAYRDSAIADGSTEPTPGSGSGASDVQEGE
jgi:penicillin-binding protein 2